MWLVGGIIRTETVKDVLGGVSAVFKHWLTMFFRSAADFRKGVFVQCSADSFILVAILRTVPADEAALKGIWNTKGSAGLKPCMNCMNLCSVRSELEGGSFVSVSCHNISKLTQFSDETLWDAADKLAACDARRIATNGSKAALEKLEKSLGLCYDPDGVLWAYHCSHAL